MDWWAAVDGYCERIGPAYWAEPLNAITNAAFPIAALWVWPRTRGVPLARVLAVVLGLIGLGSFLFHTHANPLTGLADVLPILCFILIYIFAASRDFLGLPRWLAGVTVLAFFPFTALMVPALSYLMPWLGSSAGYVPVALLILLYALLLRRRSPATARRMAAGGGLLLVSIAFRTLDAPLCPALPIGTHFLWHVLNAILLGWMIALYCRHRLAAAAPQG